MTVSNNKERITINIDKNLMAKVRTTAKQESRSYSNLVHQAVKEYINKLKEG